MDASRWILTSRRFRICVGKVGRGSFWPSYGRLKLTLFSKKTKTTKMSRWKKFIRPQFSKYHIVKSAILSFRVFLSTFLHEITLWAKDIDNSGCLEQFLPLWELFWNRVSVQLNCASDLTPRLNLVFVTWDPSSNKGGDFDTSYEFIKAPECGVRWWWRWW